MLRAAASRQLPAEAFAVAAAEKEASAKAVEEAEAKVVEATEAATEAEEEAAAAAEEENAAANAAAEAAAKAKVAEAKAAAAKAAAAEAEAKAAAEAEAVVAPAKRRSVSPESTGASDKSKGKPRASSIRRRRVITPAEAEASTKALAAAQAIDTAKKSATAAGRAAKAVETAAGAARAAADKAGVVAEAAVKAEAAAAAAAARAATAALGPLGKLLDRALKGIDTNVGALGWDADKELARLRDDEVVEFVAATPPSLKYVPVVIIRKCVPGAGAVLFVVKTSPLATEVDKHKCVIQSGSGTSIVGTDKLPSVDTCLAAMLCVFAIRHLLPAEPVSVSFGERPQKQGFVVPQWLLSHRPTFMAVVNAGLVFGPNPDTHPLERLRRYLASRCGRIAEPAPGEDGGLLNTI